MNTPRIGGRWAALATVALMPLMGACQLDDPRLPLSYMRQAVSPEGAGDIGLFARRGEPRALDEDLPPAVSVDWDSIQARDTLTALLTFNSTGFFIYRGEPMGFEYELLKAFADHHDVVLRTEVVPDRRDLFRSLNLGIGDVVAARLVAVPEYDDDVFVTRPLYQTRPVAIQRDPEAPVAATRPAYDTVLVTGDSTAVLPVGDRVELEAKLLQDPSELAGKEVHVPAGFDYYQRIVELSDSVGEPIEVVEVESVEEMEPLIQAVARGDIRLTVTQENLARLSQARYTNIVATPVLGDEESVVWAVRRTSPQLVQELNGWLQTDQGQRLTRVLYQKYFVDRRSYRKRMDDEFLVASAQGNISAYDSLLIRYAGEVGWDWKLLAAQVAQESRFDPQARSWVGATGLLQLMPRTAREMGVRNPRDPEDNVRGGVKYLRWLSGLWEDEITDEAERLKFILASYNAGRGHVLDAQRLTEKYGGDPEKWDDVAYWMLQKSKRSVYRDPVVRHGYVRGLEPVQYVSKILERYERYRNIDD